MKKKVVMEYAMNSSPKVLFSRLSTPGGLAEWFADDVNLKGNIFYFIWDGNEQRAEIIQKKENKNVRFKWIEDDDDSYFEFKINIDEITGDVALIITDYVDEEDASDIVGLWDTQITELKRVLGI